MLLIFGVGLHFSLNDLLAVKKIAVPGAAVRMGLATLLGMAVGSWWVWSIGAGLIFGLSLSCASTVVLLKAPKNSTAKASRSGSDSLAARWLRSDSRIIMPAKNAPKDTENSAAAP